MDTEAIKQLATDVNNVAAASFQSGKEHFERPLLAKIERLEAERIKDVKQSVHLILKLKHQRDTLLDACESVRAFIRYIPSHPGFAKPCDCGHCEMCKLNKAIANTEE